MGVEVVANDRYAGWWMLESQAEAGEAGLEQAGMSREVEEKAAELRRAVGELLGLMAKNEKELINLRNFSRIIDHFRP